MLNPWHLTLMQRVGLPWCSLPPFHVSVCSPFRSISPAATLLLFLSLWQSYSGLFWEAGQNLASWLFSQKSSLATTKCSECSLERAWKKFKLLAVLTDCQVFYVAFCLPVNCLPLLPKSRSPQDFPKILALSKSMSEINCMTPNET